MRKGTLHNPWWPVLILLLSAFAPAARADTTPPADPFAKGSRYWSIAGAVSRKPALASIALAQAMVSYYLVDDVAIECGGQVGYADSQRTSAGALGGPEFGTRWHFAKGERWSTYVEGLVGAVYQRHPLTQSSLRFNFDLQGGGGATYHASNNTVLAGGVRVHHLSNARVHGKEQNLGYDAPMLYLELLRSF
jgi:hypothetical protein